MLPICLIASVGVAASVAAGWFAPGHEGQQASENRWRPAESATFYVDAARGHDSNPGTSRNGPWRTLSPLTRSGLRGGDAVLLRGGQSFEDPIRLSSENLSATSRRAMLTIGSYGGGRATLLAPDGENAI